MTETKNEFLKRKKSEKRRQAENQVKAAYAKCEDLLSENEFGVKEPFKGLVLDKEVIRWRIQMEPEIEDLYSTIDISKALNMPRERMRDWMVRGFIKPSLPSTSKGTIAIFTRDDVLCVMLFLKLIDRGFKRETAAEYIDFLWNSKMIAAVKFITLKHSVRDGNPVIDRDFYVGEEDLDFQIGSDGKITVGPFSPTDSDEWEGIHIINMINMAKEVDAALSKLD